MSFQNWSWRSLLSAAALFAATLCLSADEGAGNVRAVGVEQHTSAPAIERPRTRGGSRRRDLTPGQLAKGPSVQNPRIRVS
jgi:hypothetical protein